MRVSYAGEIMIRAARLTFITARLLHLLRISPPKKADVLRRINAQLAR